MASFLGEIKRRKVFQVAAAYLVIAWLIMQVVDVVNEPLLLPDWFSRVVILLLAIGFPLALVLSWAFDLTPRGMELTAPATSGESESAETMAATTGVVVNITLVGALVLLLGFVGFYVVSQGDPTTTEGRQPSIAVLPLDNLSPDPDNAYLADAIHGEILTQLAKIGALKVISQTSVMEYRDTPKNMREIGAELGVETILEGGVQRLGDSVRINVQLIDTRSDAHLWAETYDRELSAENVFAIQNQMATSIASALQAVISPEEASLLSEPATLSTAAYDFYLRGNEYAGRIEAEAPDLAIQLYERALQEDSEFALAWSALSQMHSLSYFLGIDRTERRRDMALQAARTALTLQPDLPEAHLAMGKYYSDCLYDYESALEELVIAARGMPDSPALLSAQANVYFGARQSDRTHELLDQLIDLDPRNSFHFARKGWLYMTNRNYLRGEEYLDRALALEPDNWIYYAGKMQIPLWRDGDVESVKAAVEDRLMDASGWQPYFRWISAIYERDYDAAIEHLDEWGIEVISDNFMSIPVSSLYGITHRLAERSILSEESFRTSRDYLEGAIAVNPEDFRLYVSLGEALSGLGETDAAINMVRRALEMPVAEEIHYDAILRVYAAAAPVTRVIEALDAFLSSGWGSFSIEGLSPDPRFDRVRNTPEFQELHEKHGR